MNLWLLLAGWVGLSVPAALLAGAVLGGGSEHRTARRPLTVVPVRPHRTLRHPLHG